MTRPERRLRAGPLMARGFKDLSRRPFSTLLLINLFLSLVTTTLPADDTGIFTWLLLTALSVYVQIATILAAGSPDPAPSGDPWIRAALRLRCFWRFVLVELFIFVMVALGLFLFVVTGFIVGAAIALSEQALVLERLGMIQALTRGSEASTGNRRAVGIIFGSLVIVPSALLPVSYSFGLNETLIGRSAASAVANILTMVGTIALTRAFVELGGKPTPPPEEVRARPRAAR